MRHAPEKAGRGLWAKPTDTPGEFRENRVPAAFGYFPRVQRGGALTGSAEKFVVERFGSSSESRTTTHWLTGRIKILAAIFLLDAAGEESGISTAVRDRVLYQKTSLLVVDALTGVEAESVYTVHP